MSELVFVYGTLKRGNGNNRHFLKDAEFIGTGHTLDGFEMWSAGFPRITYSPEGHQVTGEMYLVKSLKALDTLEGVPNHYQRKRIKVFVCGHVHRPWIYVQKKNQNWDWNMIQFGVKPKNGMLEWRGR